MCSPDGHANCACQTAKCSTLLKRVLYRELTSPQIWVSEAHAKILSVTFVLVTAVDQMVLGPVRCLAKIHCTAALACEMANFHAWEMTHP